MARIQTIVAALACLGLASCGGAIGQNAASSQDQDDAADSASREYIDCLRAADAKIDDGRTDPDKIALEVAAQCTTQYAALKTTLGAGMAEDVRRTFYTDMDSKQLADVSNIVIRHRANPSVADQQ